MTMSRQEAEDLATILNDEASTEGTGWTFAAVQADNHHQWAVAGLDEDGTPTSIWVTPDLSFPTNF